MKRVKGDYINYEEKFNYVLRSKKAESYAREIINVPLPKVEKFEVLIGISDNNLEKIKESI